MPLWSDLRRLAQRWGRRQAAPVVHPAVRPLPIVGQRAKSVAAALQQLADWPALESRDYRTAVIQNCRYDLCDARLVRFSQAFTRVLRAHGVPLVPYRFRKDELELERDWLHFSMEPPEGSPFVWGCGVQYVHLSRMFDLTRREWSAVADLADEAARRCHVDIDWQGRAFPYNPSTWLLSDWENTVFQPWRGDTVVADIARCNNLVNVVQLRVNARRGKQNVRADKRRYWTTEDERE